MTNKIFIFDFDSTFVQTETHAELLKVSLANTPQQQAAEILAECEKITEQTMAGHFSFSEALQLRNKVLQPTKQDIETTIKILKNKISPSFLQHKTFFKENAEKIYVCSGGFIELIWPIVKEFGIKREHVYANQFIFDFEGNVVGFNENNILTQDQGKVKLLHTLKFSEDVIVVGDGYNDYEIKAAGLCKSFFCYTETVQRETVMKNADAIISDLDGLFIACDIPTKNTPKRLKALLLENIHPYVQSFLHQYSYEVETIPSALSEAELINKLQDVALLGIRSKTQITEKVIKNAPHLKTIGAFCIGTNQIDLETATKNGVAVFNAPYSNTRSVVELALATIIMLKRKILEKNQGMHQGVWQKTSVGSNEVRGKKLGIIGYGNIGSQLSTLAENLGMQVYYYDLLEKLPLGNAKACQSQAELLKKVDIISLHVDGRPENQNLIDENAIAQMKDGAILLNLSRGHVVDIQALATALKSGKLAGAAVDVFPKEPKNNNETFESELQNCPNTLLTPHIGGSTLEAQHNIGEFVANRLHEYASLGSTLSSVNFPELQLPSINGSHRIIHIHQNVPGILAQINSLFAKHETNIEGQYLKTNADIGYVITDVNQADEKIILEELSRIPHTIKVRVLY